MGALAELASYVEEAVKNLDQLLSERRAEEVLEDYFYLNAVLYVLQTSIQALIDMTYRLLSEMGVKPPSSYGEASLQYDWSVLLVNYFSGGLHNYVHAVYSLIQLSAYKPVCVAGSLSPHDYIIKNPHQPLSRQLINFYKEHISLPVHYPHNYYHLMMSRSNTIIFSW